MWSGRRAFARSTLRSTEVRLEIMLRLLRGDVKADRPGFPPREIQSTAVASLAAQLEAPYPQHQTPLSLGCYSLFKCALELAELGPGREVVDRRVSDILRSLPYNLIVRALDSMFKCVVELC